MPLFDVLASSSLGSLLGMRHALEPDHLAAVSTLVTEERSTWKAAVLGVFWGVGHTCALLAVGIVLVALRAEMPARLTDVFELFVAMMLIVLGLRAIIQAMRRGAEGPVQAHQHGRTVHVHRAAAAHVHIGAWTFARRPLLVGAVHGLAGSGALTALVLTTLPSTAARLAYLALFGIGSTLGMAALSGVLGWPLARASASRSVARTVSFVVGCVSTALGLAWGYPLVGRLL